MTLATIIHETETGTRKARAFIPTGGINGGAAQNAAILRATQSANRKAALTARFEAQTAKDAAKADRLAKRDEKRFGPDTDIDTVSDGNTLDMLARIVNR